MTHFCRYDDCVLDEALLIFLFLFFLPSDWKDGLIPSLLRKFSLEAPEVNYSYKADPIMKILQLDGGVRRRGETEG